MRHLRQWALVLLLSGAAAAALAAGPSRAQALKALDQPDPRARVVAIARLAEIGTMADADRLVARLADPEPPVRVIAAAALWQIWSRSGDAAIDRLFARGIEQMRVSA